jgi:hypothetical protein
VRRVPRLPVALLVKLKSGGKIKEGTIKDLGLKGAFVSLTPSVELEDPLVAMEFVPPARQEPMEVLARIVRKTEEGFGAEFLPLDPQQLETLWSSLATLWPTELKECPYCGQNLIARRRRCALCHLPLDFDREGYLDRLPKDTETIREMIGTCPAMHTVFSLIRKAALSEVPVLIVGANGTGKEMVAEAIHQRSPRAKRPLVTVNCAVPSRELLASELFGYEKGAFVGASRTVAGKLELAHRGTLFLDEVEELHSELQARLLRFLQDNSFKRLGGRKKIKVDLRVISASNPALKELVAAGRFREDLYRRLNGLEIPLPDLQDRGDDLLIMAAVFLKQFSSKSGKEIHGFAREAAQALKAYSWPGNVRELINRVRRAVALAEGEWVTPENLGLGPAP